MFTIALVSQYPFTGKGAEDLEDAAGQPVRLLECSEDRERLAAEGADVEVVYGRVRPHELPHLPRLRWIHAPWTGVENVVCPELRARNIILTNTRGQSSVPMGEHVLAGLLYFARDFPAHQAADARHEWSRRQDVFLLSGSRVLVLGVGAIGRELIPLLRAFGAEVIGVNSDGRPVAGCAATYTMQNVRRHLDQVDHLVVLLPATPHTRQAVDHAFLQALRPGAVVVNVSRGTVLDQDALLECVQSGHLRGAVLDVTDPEPLPPESPLWDAPRILITAHRSWRPVHGVQSAPEVFLHNLRCFASGQADRMRNVVDMAQGY